MLKNIPTNTIFYGIMLVGFFVRFFHFGNIPTGFHGDEASIGYEAFSLLSTGNDRWGYHLPAYFLSWGSGQNTLYAYLSIPFVYFFGLNETSVRMLSGVLGILCVPLAYQLVKTLFQNKNLAQLTAILYIFDPFLFMTSRWGDEFNIVPFFVLLFLVVSSKAILIAQNKKVLNIWEKTTLISVFPVLIFLFYAYAPSLFIVPLFLLFFVVFYRQAIWSQIKYFGVSALLGGVMVSPFFLFILKNNILKHELPFEKSLPFSLPIMLSPRERIFIGFSENLAIIKQNMFFVFSGFIDMYVWVYNSTHFRMPHFFVIFLLPAVIILANKFWKNSTNPQNILLFWLLASFSIFFLYHVNLNRSLHFQAVVPIAVAFGLFSVYQKLAENKFKKLVLVGVFCFFVIQATAFFGEYFIKFPSYSVFPKDVKWAIDLANNSKQKNEKIAISKDLVFNYLYAAFHSKYAPEKFQKEVTTDKTTGNVIVKSFGDYFMLGDAVNTPPDNVAVINQLQNESNFVAVLHNNEHLAQFKNYKEEAISQGQDHEWKVVRYTKITE